MVLSDKQILEHMKKGTVLIDPFIRENLCTSSYDMTLGEWYFREEVPKQYQNIFNPYSKKHTEAVWGIKPYRAEKASKAFAHFNFKYDGISPNDKVILLEPGETILGHTNEFIGGKDPITTMMKARSSLGRVFIEVCKCAGWGDVGYTNRWTMEITNNSRNYLMPLVVGRRISQMVFFETDGVIKKNYTDNGKYQTTTDLEKLKKDWKPEMMLPRLYKDKDIKKK